ncbi:hypothetical protein BH10ACI2_BH10ACI2_08580 [soil metagenome]
MKKNDISTFVILFLAAARFVSGQTVSSTPTVDQMIVEEQKIQAQIRLLQAQQEYLSKLKAASGTTNITADTSGGKTTVIDVALPNLETVSLSYQAVQEIAAAVDHDLKPSISQYRRLVLYYEPDFLALIKYRVYRDQVRLALSNYARLAAKIDEESKPTTKTNSDGSPRIRTLGSDILTGLNAPSMATAAIRSVAELAALFRTDKTIAESRDIVDSRSMGSVIAGTFLRSNPNLIVYHPEQFVPEYDISSSDDTSLYAQSLKINAAAAYLDYFLTETGKLPVPEQNMPPVDRLISGAKLVRTQIRNLGFSGDVDNDPDPTRAVNNSALKGVSEFRQMIRAEKLDRMLVSPSGEKCGIVKIRLLSSGGSKRDSKNIIFGNKTDYSGSAVIEVALYDADGTMRASKVYSYHTGFRKLKTGEATQKQP